MKIDKFIITKYHFSGTWKYVLKKEHWLFGYLYVRCDNGSIGGSIIDSILPFFDIKMFDTEKEAEEAINNILYKKTIER